jgi:hypothetical protein
MTPTDPAALPAAPAIADERVQALATLVERVAPGVYAVPAQPDGGELCVVVDRQAAGISGTGRWACDCADEADRQARPPAAGGALCVHAQAVVARRQLEQWQRAQSQRAPGGRR